MAVDATSEEQSPHDSLFDESPTTPEAPSISRIFVDAALYEKVLGPKDGAGDTSTEGGGDGFADLVGCDLDCQEKAITGRLAKLSVNGDSWTPSDKSFEDDTSSQGTSPSTGSPFDDKRDPLEEWDEDEEKEEEPPLGGVPRPPFPHRSATTDDQSWKLSEEEVTDLLIQEFGPLAAEGDEEKVILEADGAFFQDITIVGVIHLTTHRIAFHASLLATRPDLLPSQQVIKSGPAVIHRKGFHKKRRVWMELSHDMLSTYASSRDEDRIRPLRSILLSSVKEICPVDPKHPRRIMLVFDSMPKVKGGAAAFDTEESARDWRREMEGALYLYRHTRRKALDKNIEEGDNGVRLSIPLDRISRYEIRKCLTFTSIFSLYIDGCGDLPSSTGKTTEALQLVTIRPDTQWDKLGEYIDNAKKARFRDVDTDSDTASNMVVDFGPLSFLENDMRNLGPDTRDEKERAVRHSLALQHESDVWIARARVYHNITSSGYFALSEHYVGFWSKYITQLDLRYRLALSVIKQAKPFSPKLLHAAGMRLEIEGQADLKLEFKSSDLRDEAVKRVNAAIEADRIARTNSILGGQSEHASPRSMTPLDSPPPLSRASSLAGSSPGVTSSSRSPVRSATGILAPMARTVERAVAAHIPEELRARFPKPINLPRPTLFTPASTHFVCLTIGSRGDVQPYIALCLGLKKEGHTVTIVTHEEYKEWVQGFGIEHRTAGGDPGALMKLSVENKMFSPEFFRESLSNFRGWLDELLVAAWEQCKDADVLLESPSAMAGVHIAEALNIPYFRCFTMPWTKTAEFPHAFLSPPVESPTFNAASYVLFDNVMWTATSGQINRWRRKTLNIGNTDMGHMAQSKITFIYNFSPAVVPKPLDWGDTTIVSGYWFLDNPDLDWTPPPSLIEWMAEAKKDQKPIVYIGFGSITVPNPHLMTEHIIKAVLKSDVRAIVSKGWSARMSKHDEPEIEMPPECYSLDKVPHDWLFPQIDAALHHGGAGTTGASLRAGIPTLVKPWFGDQFFWASRVQKLGAGLKVPSLRVNDLAEALTKATTSRVMKEKAASIGERIRAEDGVHAAIHAIYTWLPRAARDRQTLQH